MSDLINLRDLNSEEGARALAGWLDNKYRDLSSEQKGQFIALCKLHNLNPLLNQVYAIKYGNNFNLIVNHEVFLAKAHASGELDGWDFEIDRGEPTNPIVTCKVYRSGRSRPFSYSASFKEYTTKQNLWLSKPMAMIQKVALSLAIRKAFADIMASMPPTREEMEQSLPQMQAQPQPQPQPQVVEVVEPNNNNNDNCPIN